MPAEATALRVSPTLSRPCRPPTPNSCGFYDFVEGRSVGSVDDDAGVGHRDRLSHIGGANSDPVDLAVHGRAPHLRSQGPQAASDERVADM